MGQPRQNQYTLTTNTSYAYITAKHHTYTRNITESWKSLSLSLFSDHTLIIFNWNSRHISHFVCCFQSSPLHNNINVRAVLFVCLCANWDCVFLMCSTRRISSTNFVLVCVCVCENWTTTTKNTLYRERDSETQQATTKKRQHNFKHLGNICMIFLGNRLEKRETELNWAELKTKDQRNEDK